MVVFSLWFVSFRGCTFRNARKPPQKEISSSNHPFSDAMLVAWRQPDWHVLQHGILVADFSLFFPWWTLKLPVFKSQSYGRKPAVHKNLLGIYFHIQDIHPPNTNLEYPKMMFWKRWVWLLIMGQFWVSNVQVLGVSLLITYSLGVAPSQ